MKRYYLYLAAALLLAGCTSVPVQSPGTSPAVVPEPTAEIPVPTAEPPAATVETPLFGEPPAIVPPEPTSETTPEPTPEPAPVMSLNRAVIALLDRAQLDNTSGKRDAAGASLERALRIEPRNPWLWHELAQLRLTQGQYAQAITLAHKSTSFAAQDKRLLALNWRVIGNARVAQGDPTGAEQAFKQAEALEQPPEVVLPGF